MDTEKAGCTQASDNDLIEFLKTESGGHYTEFRIVVRADGSAYIHPLGKDGKTLDLKL